jgi:hypothetical protein
MAEHQQPMIERVADLESDVRALLRQIEQLQREPKFVPPQPIEWVRTKGPLVEGAYGPVSDYPAQDVAAPECELPAVFLTGTCPANLADPFVWTPRSATPQTKIISPGGWIPEAIEPIAVFRHRDGRYHVLIVPVLRVVAFEDIAAGNWGTVRLWRNGVSTGENFAAWNDWLHGGTTIENGKQARATLDWDVRRWSVSAGVEC